MNRAFTHFIINLIHQRHVNMNFFSDHFIYSQCYFIKDFPHPHPPPPCPLVGSKLSKLMYIPQQKQRQKQRRLFFKFYFYCYLLMNFNITRENFWQFNQGKCLLISNCDSSKKFLILLFLLLTLGFFFFFFFSDNFLYLLKYRCDVKLKPVLIYCSVFNPLGSGFIHLPEHFLVVVAIFPWLLILSPLKKW